MEQTLEIIGMDGGHAVTDRARAVDVLETGGMVVVPQSLFHLRSEEQAFLDPAILSRAKNVSFDPTTGAVGGVDAAHAVLEASGMGRLTTLMRRFSAEAQALLAELAPAYRDHWQVRRTSFRPGAIADRALSRRKDDRRLHIDAFPANPVQGRRILRVFANVNPSGEARLWDVGEEGFEAFASRYLSNAPHASRLGAWVRGRLGLTKGRRSAYDAVMLSLHDRAKLDDAYQASASKRRVALPAGSMWVVYTDSVLHAALAGQHAFEQTFLLPVDAMADERRSPLRVLERLTGRSLT